MRKTVGLLLLSPFYVLPLFTEANADTPPKSKTTDAPRKLNKIPCDPPYKIKFLGKDGEGKNAFFRVQCESESMPFVCSVPLDAYIEINHYLQISGENFDRNHIPDSRVYRPDPTGPQLDGTMSGIANMMPKGNAMMTPIPVSGTVLRYYVDRAGFVSAMDVQSADGVKMVRFSPSLAQRLTSTYPVGSQISAYVTSPGMGSIMSYDLAGLGTDMPTPTSMMQPMTLTELDVLRGQPYIMLGAKSMRTSGKLTGYIPDPQTGEVLAIIIDKNTLIRVPAENRLPQASMVPEGITPLSAKSNIVAYGYDEAPRYGVISPYGKRVIATTITVNGRALGPFGFGKVDPNKKGTLLGFNLNFFGGSAPDTITADNSGYTTYMAPSDSIDSSTDMPPM